MTLLAPPRDVAHDDRHIATAGGVASDRRAGTLAAAHAGKRWIDNNGQLMHRTHAGIALAGADRDLVWVNAHGAPFNPAYIPKGDRFEDHAYEDVHSKHPGLRTSLQTFKQNCHEGLSTEWEAKDLHPFGHAAALEHAFELLAQDAEAAYGSKWHKRAQVKVLTNLAGGLEYALHVCKAAHGVGFTTLILPRGADVHRVINEPYITYNRGGRVR